MTHSLDDALVEKVARAIHIARYGERKPDPMCDTDWGYCGRLARAALEAAGVAELRVENERLRKAVEHAEHVFRCYAELHDAKGTAEGRTKARRNMEHAERMAAALTNQGKAQG